MIKAEYNRWQKIVEDSALREELELMEKDVVAVNDAFYRHLEFGTGGLRGVLGAGTNRMNIYTVARASLGLASIVIKNGEKRVAIGYDTRINSRLFAETAAKVFSDCGLDVYMYSGYKGFGNANGGIQGLFPPLF